MSLLTFLALHKLWGDHLDRSRLIPLAGSLVRVFDVQTRHRLRSSVAAHLRVLDHLLMHYIPIEVNVPSLLPDITSGTYGPRPSEVYFILDASEIPLEFENPLYPNE
jgi:hypothetical protein